MLRLPHRFVAASGSMGPSSTGWHPLQRWLFYTRLTPTLKTVTLNPRPVYSLFEAYRPFFREQSCVNAMRLGNPGVVCLIEKIIPRLPRPSIVSIHSSDINECEAICDILTTALSKSSPVLAIEINLSCPNVVSLNLCEMAAILECTKTLPWPIIAKIGHQPAYIDLALEAAKNNLIDGVSAINSVPWHEIFPPDIKSPLEAKCGQPGGVSGKLIKNMALEATRQLRQRLDELGKPYFPLICGGGISSPRDAKQFELAGASYFSLGSSLNMPNLWPEVWQALH